MRTALRVLSAVLGLLLVLVGSVASNQHVAAATAPTFDEREPTTGFSAELSDFVYDHRPGLARPPPLVVDSEAYDIPTGIADPIADGGRVRRVSSGLVVDRVAPSRPGSYANWGDEISDGARMVDQPFSSRGFSPDFADGARSPGVGFEWRGTGPAGSRQGNWYNPRTGESLHPDLGHPGPIGPHYDYKAPDGSWFRVFPDGRVQPK